MLKNMYVIVEKVEKVETLEEREKLMEIPFYSKS
jgi:hypothetical protein